MSGQAILRVAQAGPHVTIQDGGRRRMKRYGVPASGPMDRLSFAIANRAIGNPLDAPAIEVSLGGLSLDCIEGSVTVAVAGGGFLVETTDARPGSWHVLTLRTGDRLTIRRGPWGSWTYLALAGDLEARRWLDSASTHSLSGLGGGALVPGSELRVSDPRAEATGARRIPFPLTARSRRVVDVVLGPQDQYFTAESISALQREPFYLTDSYDRMGVRMRGPSLRSLEAMSIPSEPIVRGSIQVPGDGVATVLLADHQTTGGYPKIATIARYDVDGFVQLRPRDGVLFRPVTPTEAIRRARLRARTFSRFMEAVRSPTH